MQKALAYRLGGLQVSEYYSSLQKLPNKHLYPRHCKCFWFFFKQAMGRKTHGQVLHSILLVREFGQGEGSPNSGSFMDTDVHLLSTEAGCVPSQIPAVLSCQAEEIQTDRTKCEDGRETRGVLPLCSCLLAYAAEGNGETWLQRLFTCHV